MKISYSDDTQRGAGHGVLTCREADFPQGPYSMAVLRASDQASLAGAGGGAVWVGETRFIPVKTETTPEGGLTVLLGPEVVNALDPLEQYLVTLKPEQGDPLKARLQVEGITYSPAGALDNTGMRPAEDVKPAPQAQEPAAPAVPSEPEPEPAPDAAPVAENPAEEALTLAPEAPPKPRRVNPVLLVALLAALLAGALGTWKFFDSKAQEEEAALGRKPAPEAVAPSTALPPTQKSAEEQVRAFFSGPDITAAAALKLAAELPKATPAEQDAVYRLYYFAAENEAPGAFMPYAACLDPAEPQWGSIGKDAAAAYAAYAKAAASEPKAAKAALDAQTRLRAWLDREAAAGNARARAWLQELP